MKKNNPAQPEHPTLSRFRSGLGRKQGTAKAVLKIIKTDPRLRFFPPRAPASLCEWADQEARRISDPDAKRARHDMKFRRNFLARVSRREARATAYDAASISGICQRADSRDERRTELFECGRLRSVVANAKVESKPLEKCMAGNPLSVTVALARKLGATVICRGKDASLTSTRSASNTVHKAGKTIWRNGKAVGYVRAENATYVRSFALIVSPKTSEYIIHTTAGAVTLPPGYHWERDPSGLLDGLSAVITASPSDDYHPSGEDMLAENAAQEIVEKLLANRERRRVLRAEQVVEAARAQGVFVCAADALRSGNCRIGTASFAARHGLELARHYDAQEIIGLAGEQAARVRLVVTAAILRHEREMQAGVCLMSAHRIDE